MTRNEKKYLKYTHKILKIYKKGENNDFEKIYPKIQNIVHNFLRPLEKNIEDDFLEKNLSEEEQVLYKKCLKDYAKRRLAESMKKADEVIATINESVALAEAKNAEAKAMLDAFDNN